MESTFVENYSEQSKHKEERTKENNEDLAIVTINIDDYLLEILDFFVKTSIFSSRSQAVRYYLFYFLRKTFKDERLSRMFGRLDCLNLDQKLIGEISDVFSELMESNAKIEEIMRYFNQLKKKKDVLLSWLDEFNDKELRNVELFLDETMDEPIIKILDEPFFNNESDLFRTFMFQNIGDSLIGLEGSDSVRLRELFQGMKIDDCIGNERDDYIEVTINGEKKRYKIPKIKKVE
jgi:Arc/MetJ-type ribon-helix-helix transcriptional regulator